MRSGSRAGQFDRLIDFSEGRQLAEKIIIAIIVVVTLAAHYWLYRWVKFKVDEGVVLKCLEDAKAVSVDSALSSETIAQQSEIKLARVALVCQQSAKIQRSTGAHSSADSSASWQLTSGARK